VVYTERERSLIRNYSITLCARRYVVYAEAPKAVSKNNWRRSAFGSGENLWARPEARARQRGLRSVGL
jgi:hypothetical protein